MIALRSLTFSRVTSSFLKIRMDPPPIDIEKNPLPRNKMGGENLELKDVKRGIPNNVFDNLEHRGLNEWRGIQSLQKFLQREFGEDEILRRG